MTTDRLPARTCPRCGVAMVGRKADPRSTEEDTFECPLCATVVSYPFDERPPKTVRRPNP